MGIMQSERKLADLHCYMETFRAFFDENLQENCCYGKIIIPEEIYRAIRDVPIYNFLPNSKVLQKIFSRSTLKARCLCYKFQNIFLLD